MADAAYNDVRAKGELIQQRLRQFVDWEISDGRYHDSKESHVASQAAETIEWYEKRCDSLIDEVAELRAELRKSKDATFNAFMAGLGPSKWER